MTQTVRCTASPFQARWSKKSRFKKKKKKRRRRRKKEKRNAPSLIVRRKGAANEFATSPRPKRATQNRYPSELIWETSLFQLRTPPDRFENRSSGAERISPSASSLNPGTALPRPPPRLHCAAPPPPPAPLPRGPREAVAAVGRAQVRRIARTPPPARAHVPTRPTLARPPPPPNAARRLPGAL